MKPDSYIKRFSKTDRVFHIFLMLTFLIQTATGFGRLFGITEWGRKMVFLFGGYATCLKIHQAVGIVMTVVFVVHAVSLMGKIKRHDIMGSILGPDSIVPNLKDMRDAWRNSLWIFGIGTPPEFDRWAYWEKFDYWAVFWGMPLLSITGLMLIFPLETSRVVPGWSLNIAAFLHRAEAVLAVSYIFIVHFFLNHLKPSNFPMSETMFSGNVSMEHMAHEKTQWLARLKQAGKLGPVGAPPPKTWFRVVYYAYGLTAVGLGLYLLINGIYFSRYIRLH
ncbi:MAG: cytochrome b/b6 domain-containing protein [Desulfosalsimonadaceae bacterium]